MNILIIILSFVFSFVFNTNSAMAQEPTKVFISSNTELISLHDYTGEVHLYNAIREGAVLNGWMDQSEILYKAQFKSWAYTFGKHTGIPYVDNPENGGNNDSIVFAKCFVINNGKLSLPIKQNNITVTETVSESSSETERLVKRCKNLLKRCEAIKASINNKVSTVEIQSLKYTTLPVSTGEYELEVTPITGCGCNSNPTTLEEARVARFCFNRATRKAGSRMEKIELSHKAEIALEVYYSLLRDSKKSKKKSKKRISSRRFKKTRGASVSGIYKLFPFLTCS